MSKPILTLRVCVWILGRLFQSSGAMQEKHLPPFVEFWVLSTDWNFVTGDCDGL